jgi:uncharacterized membrane protein
MFEFLFKYPWTVFQKGSLVLLGSWPVWVMAALAAVAAVALAAPVWRLRGKFGGRVENLRAAGIWLMQTLLVALILLLLWQPALSIATLKPQQNIVAVVMDDSRSMSIADDGRSRIEQVKAAAGGAFLDRVRKQFQVRLFRLGRGLDRLEKVDSLSAAQPATRIGSGLRQVLAEAGTLPIGAVVLMSDGSDNSGGIDLETLQQIRQKHIPVHTVGFGRERFAHDLELADVQVAPRALADSRLRAMVSFRERGYAGRNAKLVARVAGKALASRDVSIKADGVLQTEPLVFNAGGAGAKTIDFAIEPFDNEENRANNALTRLVNVESRKPRLLYIEGEPKWEYKFIRRAAEEDRSLELISMLRTTQNKIYRQGISDPKELEDGFPSKVEDLFGYQGLVIGGVEAGYFTPAQQELIKQFVDRRGGGVLFLGGRSALSEGSWQKSPVAELLPVTLPDKTGTFVRDPANVELTAAGRDSLICRIEDSVDRNVERWKKLPYLANYQAVGAPKPGAVVLAEMMPTSKGRFPLLVTQNYGHGRVALFATAGSWRWKMLQDHTDRSHVMFWQQLLRWLVEDTPGRVDSSTPRTVISDETSVHLRAQVHDRTYLWMNDARVEARVLGPDGAAARAELALEPGSEGVYSVDWAAEKPGSYLAEIVATRGAEEVGRDVVMFRREDGVAENFHAEQNRELLEKLAQQTGGRYYRPDQVNKLAEDVAYSEAGITVRETRDLWDMPVVFLAALALRAGEWLLRRRWGVV